MDGFTFSTPVRVRFADTDAQGIAHNAAYLVWFEVARVEYLRAFAGGYQALRDRGIEALVLESLCRYRAPAVFDDELAIHCRCVGLRGARFRFEYAMTRGDELVADGHTEHACVDAARLAGRSDQLGGELTVFSRSAPSCATSRESSRER